MRTKITFEQFEQDLHQALIHLYDPAYQVPVALGKVLGCRPQPGDKTFQTVVIEAISRLKPAPDVPPSARVQRLYTLLFERYIRESSQEETAHRLGITPRHLRREQQQALHILAQRLWVDSNGDEEGWSGSIKPATTQPPTIAPSWRTQVHQELVSLQHSDPGAMADVLRVIQDAVKMEQAIVSRHAICLTISAVPSNLMTPIHPSVLRQILLIAIQMLARALGPGQITLIVTKANQQIIISITGAPVAAAIEVENDFIRETLAALGGSLAIEATEYEASLHLRLPAVERIQVLVVDDNADLVYFYHRYTERTRYQLSHITKGQQLAEAVTTLQPDLIVLDVMLPDVDGWELLTRLYADPVTRTIPTLVCSVVRNEELALALGATAYVQKPVGRQELIRALDWAWTQGSAAGQRKPTNSAIGA